VQKFTVQDPVKVGGNVKYTVTGVDDEGDFNTVRRYREFHALAQTLKTRWPGCYVPQIPEKKLMNQNNETFVEERRSLLERFMKEIAKYDYIVFSKEFKVFAKGKGEIDKVLQAMPKQTPMQVLEKYRLNFQIDEEQDAASFNTYKERIMIFQTYLKKAIGVMEMQKKTLKSMSTVRDKQDKAQTELIHNLMKYEDIAIAYYSD
jgi:sorting nexin-1/2